MKKVTFLIAALICGAWCATAQNTSDGHEYVDLGLPSGVRWATCNVGATAPEGYGNYYAWGETETKDYYYWDNYAMGSGSILSDVKLTKYCNDASCGQDNFTDTKTVLDPEDDAARANWGGKWRMPTDAEWTELRDNCEWAWTDNYNGTGVAGRIVTSKTNSNSIFLPAAGYRNAKTTLNLAGTNGEYWASSLETDYSKNAWEVSFYASAVGRYSQYRCYGLSVRPVVDKSGSTTALQPATAAVNMYTQAGRIVCEGEFRIYDLLGRDVTRLNGSLCGVYVVKTADTAVKVVVK
ncbi:MAG: hypothetical protein ACI392_03595 [Paludibacteraceae bacterium]